MPTPCVGRSGGQARQASTSRESDSATPVPAPPLVYRAVPMSTTLLVSAEPRPALALGALLAAVARGDMRAFRAAALCFKRATMFAPPMTITDESGNTLLHLAVEHNHESMLRVLLGEVVARGLLSVDAANARGETPLAAAVWAARTTSVSALLDSRASLLPADADGFTVLHLAAAQGNGAMLERLVAHARQSDAATLRVLVAARDSEGWSALRWAIASRAAAAIRALVEVGAALDHTELAALQSAHDAQAVNDSRERADSARAWMCAECLAPNCGTVRECFACRTRCAGTDALAGRKRPAEDETRTRARHPSSESSGSDSDSDPSGFRSALERMRARRLSGALGARPIDAAVPGPPAARAPPEAERDVAASFMAQMDAFDALEDFFRF